MSFKVPDMEYSSSPVPSTPNRKESNLFSFGASNNPTTTPAGPPPSSTGSFTPAGAPPTLFGSSLYSNTPSKPLNFNQPSPSPIKFGNPDSSLVRGYTQSTAGFQSSMLGSKYKPTPQRGFRPPSVDDDEEDEEGEDDEEEAEHMEGGEYEDEYEEEEAMADHDDLYEDEEGMEEDPQYDQQSASDQASNQEDFGRSMLSLKGSMVRSNSKRPKDMVYSLIAKELYSQIDPPDVVESDEVVLSTEDIIAKLYNGAIREMSDDESVLQALATIPEEFVKLWNGYQKQTAVYESQEYAARIGPGPKTTGFTKADFLADLTLHVYHPQVEVKAYIRKLKPLPQTMLEWLNKHHNPYPSQFEEIQTHRPSPANHRLFWDMIFNKLLRGKIGAVVGIMRNGGWRHARGGNDEIRQNGQVGYTGVALANVERVIGAATDVLSQCPAYQGDWDTRNGDWTLFRIKASQALDDLKRFAEGKDYDNTENLRSSSFAPKSDTYSRTAKKAQSLVPWFIYQRLISLYNFMMGDRDEIISNSQDWCEATFGLLAWWDEGREDRQVALGRSRSDYRAASRDSDTEAYIQKVRRSFEAATTEASGLHVNTSDPVEVGLASLLEGDSESVIGFLRAWSGPISSAVAEIGSLGGWLSQSEPPNLMNMSLDEQDMMILGIDSSSPSKSDSIKDKTLIAYAKALSHRGVLKSSSSQTNSRTIEGWELSIAVLGRLDSATRSEEMVGEFLRRFKLDSSDTVDKLWKLLNDIGMTSQAEHTAETYANHLAEGSHKYGEALWYYALSHKSSKVKDVLDLLISYSLVQSIAYPPESDLDDHLRRLVSSPKTALVAISQLDVDAAELLHKMLSGYATLRRFYSLRDEEILGIKSEKVRSGSKALKSEAMSALMTVIISSDDNIRGGLYDEGRGAVVSVDFLLALLGEASVFVNQGGCSLTVSDIDTLLKAIEDIQAVGSRIYSACTEFLQTVLASAQGLHVSSPTDLLRKSTSNLSGTSSFSMVGSSMLASQLKQSMTSSGVLVKGNIKRGWDWRDTLPAGTTAEDLLRILRHGLAHKLADSWLAEVDNLM